MRRRWRSRGRAFPKLDSGEDQNGAKDNDDSDTLHGPQQLAVKNEGKQSRYRDQARVEGVADETRHSGAASLQLATRHHQAQPEEKHHDARQNCRETRGGVGEDQMENEREEEEGEDEEYEERRREKS